MSENKTFKVSTETYKKAKRIATKTVRSIKGTFEVAINKLHDELIDTKR